MIHNLTDAYAYVNERYVFNKENYPVMAKLTDEENVFFTLKHGLLHMQKSILTIVDAEKFYWNVRTNDAYKKAIIKTLVNMIVVSEVVQLTSKEIEQLKIEETPLKLSDVVLKMMKDVATQCEAFDHHQNPQAVLVLPQMKVKDAMMSAWNDILYLFQNQLQQGFKLQDALGEIPSVMKSK